MQTARMGIVGGGLSGLYAVQLQVLRTDQRVDTTITQVTVRP